MVDNNTIVIKVQDDTSSGNYSKNDMAQLTTNTAIKPKTETSLIQKSTSNQVAKTMGMSAANTVTGGMAGQAMGLAASAATPIGIAMLALTIAQKAYARFEDVNRRLNETDDIRLQAGGSTRGEVNQQNLRRRVIGGRVVGGQGTYIRR